MLLNRAFRVLRGCLLLGVRDVSSSKSVLLTSKKVSELSKCLRLIGERPYPLGHRATRGGWDSSKAKFSECPFSWFLHPRLAAVCLRYTLCLLRTHGRKRPMEFTPFGFRVTLTLTLTVWFYLSGVDKSKQSALFYCNGLQSIGPDVLLATHSNTYLFVFF